jgi:hypothetical protein
MGSGEDAEWAARDAKMNEAATLTGGVGLVHTQHAQGGAPGQFRRRLPNCADTMGISTA